MVTRYDVISSRRSSNFWVKMHVFSTFFNNTNNLWMKWYKARIYGLLYMSSTENDHLSRFYVTCFLILGKMQDGDCSAWITSNLFVRSPQPKLLDLSILFSLVKLFFSSASIHLLIIRWTWPSPLSQPQAWVRNHILATCCVYVQQRSHSIRAESFSSRPKSSKRKKDSAGRVKRLRKLVRGVEHIQTKSMEFSDYFQLS